MTPRFAPEQIAELQAAGYTVVGNSEGEVTLRLHGELHDGPRGEPARVERSIGGGEITYFHYRHGQLHDGPNREPAVIRRDLARDRALAVERYHFGLRHDGPNGEPASLVRDKITGVVVSESHYHLGELHDSLYGAPACIARDARTGIAYLEQRFQYGRLRDGLNGEPARLYRDQETKTVTQAYRVIDGELMPYAETELAALNDSKARGARPIEELVDDLLRRAALLSVLIADRVAEQCAPHTNGDSVFSAAHQLRTLIVVPRDPPSPGAKGPLDDIAGYRVARGAIRSGTSAAATEEAEGPTIDDTTTDFIVTPQGVLCVAMRRGRQGNLVLRPIRTARDLDRSMDVVRDHASRPIDDAPQPVAAKIRALSAALDEQIETVGPRRAYGARSVSERTLRDLRADLRLDWSSVPTRVYMEQAPTYSDVLLDATITEPLPPRYRRLLAGPPQYAAPASERRGLGTLRASNVVVTDTQTLAIEDVYMTGVGPWRKQQSRLRPLRTVDDLPRLDDAPDDEVALMRRIALVRDAAARSRVDVTMAPVPQAMRVAASSPRRRQL